MKTQINKELLPLKAHYFLFNAGCAPVIPFMTLFARQLGFSSFSVGIIYTILPISGMLAKPLVGAVADRYRCQKLIFLAVQLIVAVSFLFITFLPEAPVDSKIHFACDRGSTVLDTCVNNRTISDDCTAASIISEAGDKTMHCKLNCPLEKDNWDTVCHMWNATKYCELPHPDSLKFTANVPMEKTLQTGSCIFFIVHNITLENGDVHYPYCSEKEHRIFSVCDVECDSYLVNDLVTESAVKDDSFYYLYQFWLLLGVYLFSWVGQAVVVSIGDAICFEMLGNNPHRYGQQRLHGAIGWGIFSLITGFAIDLLSKGGSKKNFAPLFYMAIVIMILDFLVSYRLQYTQKNLSASILKDVSRILSNIHMFVFVLWCIFVGMCTGLIWQFLFWLFEDMADAHGCEMKVWIKTLEGIAMAIQCLGGELPFFFLSGWILKRIGHVNAMSLVLAAIGIRYVVYSVMTNPWWCLPIEFSNGLTFGLFYATMASYASIAAPPGTEATVQGLVGAVFEGVGVSAGSFIGGLLYKSFGSALTFRYFGTASLIACLLHVCVQYYIQRRNSPEGKDSYARYASPQDAFDMVTDDQQELRLVGT